MKKFLDRLKDKQNLNWDLLFNLIEEKCSKNISTIRSFNANAIKLQIPCPVLSSNIAFYDLIFSNHKIGETIQLQRSFFGLHPLKNKKNSKKIKPYWTNLWVIIFSLF